MCIRDSACRFAIHSKAGQTFQREVSVTGTLIRAVNTAVQRHHHPDGAVSYTHLEHLIGVAVFRFSGHLCQEVIAFLQISGSIFP